jgi:hypothetical protein
MNCFLGEIFPPAMPMIMGGARTCPARPLRT